MIEILLEYFMKSDSAERKSGRNGEWERER